MPPYDQQQIVSEIARDVIAQVAPHELPLFRAVSEAYFARAARALKGQAARDDMLGFGSGSSATMLTPVALAAVHAVVQQLATQQGLSVTDEQIKTAFRKYRTFNPGTVPVPQPTLDIEQVRQLASRVAAQFKLPEAQTTLLVDTIVACLNDTIP